VTAVNLRISAVFIAVLLLCGCSEDSKTTVDEQGIAASAFAWNLPKHIPLPVEPEANPLTEAKFQLGRHLFYDRRLSSAGTISCASCHQQDKAFSDGKIVAIGGAGEPLKRNAQALVNVAWSASLTWANPSLVTLEQQIAIPLFAESPIEHGIDGQNKDRILTALTADPAYQTLFAGAFPESSLALSSDQTWTNIVAALASFVRGLIAYDTAFDRYLLGDRSALSDRAKNGMQLFFGERLECAHCHGGYHFSDSVRDRSMAIIERPFHNTGLYNLDGQGAYPEDNTGVFSVTGRPFEMGAFRTPSLRNVALTAPYMHDGSIASLAEVIRTYAAGGRNLVSGPHRGDGRTNPYKDSFIADFEISDDEIDDVIAFLNALTDEAFVKNPRFANPWEPL
jgi:cytochrome c peroxidase